MDTPPSFPHHLAPRSWREWAGILVIAGLTCVAMGVGLATTWNIDHAASELKRETAQAVAQIASRPTLHQRLDAMEHRLQAIEERLRAIEERLTP